MSKPTHVRVGQPEGNNDVTLYDRDGVWVTERSLMVNGTRYEIRQLGDPRTARGPRSSLRVNAAIAAGAVFLVIAIAARYLNADGWIGASIALAVPVAILGIAAANSPRPYELWAEYHGYTVMLLWADNPEHYHQICRAITRAKERMAL